MAKPGRRSGVRGKRPATEKCEALIDAAFQTLREEGYAHASARAIAGRAGCNSALVFYYFGSVNMLLVEALAKSSRTQLEKYQAALANVTRLDELIPVVQGRLRDDIASGHVKVLAELIGASSTDEQLKAKVVAQVQPWMELAEQTLERALTTSGLAGLVPADQVSFVVISLFLGMELFNNLANDAEAIDRSFDSAQRLVTLLDPAIQPGATT